MTSKLLALGLAIVVLWAAPSAAQEAPAPASAAATEPPAAQSQRPGRGRLDAGPPAQTGDALKPLPADSTTRQSLNLANRSLSFRAKVATIRITNEKGAPLADVVTLAYLLDGADSAKRPVTFVFNGGPGAGSAWLQLGAVGPWRLPMNGLTPSSAPGLVENEETWLDFTDLVFIDPPGTGYSRIVAQDQDARKELWSVNGDIEALSVVVRRWLVDNDRMHSPKFLLGESYGGFRGPRLAEALATHQGVGLSGLALISPALDFSVSEFFSLVGRLPSFAATFRERKGKVTREDMADVEQYAGHDYLIDLLAGPGDEAATARIVDRVSALTGLDRAFVKQLNGRIAKNAFQREFDRAEGKVTAFYDATITAYDPEPSDYFSRWLDPVAEGFAAPFTSAIVEVYNDRLGWKTDARYELTNEAVERGWSWGEGMRQPESISALRRMLALDPNFKVLVVHGLTDLQTPYFGTQLQLKQIPDYGPPGRLSLKVYGGGHMLYSRDESRKALREDVRQLIEGRP
jgi:carboxypeptidase C (cathepsin A)